MKLRALVPNLRGLERAIEAGVDKVMLMLSATDSHSISNANNKTFDAMKGFEPLIARAQGTTVKVTGSISVIFGCPYEGDVPLEGITQICERYIDLGIHDISLADTTGMAFANAVAGLEVGIMDFCRRDFQRMLIVLF